MPRKGNSSHAATDLHIRTELSDNKEVRFFDLLFWRTVGIISFL